MESRVEKPDPNPHNLGGLIGRSRVIIRYQYAAVGRQFENDTISFGLGNESGSLGNADEKNAKFPKGQVVDVHYDPDRPEVSCLETGVLDWEDFLVLAFALLGICLGMKIFGDFLRWLLRPRNLAVVN